MISEQGVVCKILNSKVLVRVQKSSACAHCESRDACEISNKDMLVEVVNDLHAKVGGPGRTQSSEGSLLKLSMLVYLLPVVALIAGAYAGSAWAGSVQADATLAAILGGGLAMGIAFYTLKSVDRAAAAKNRYFPRMTRIIVSEEFPESDDSI